MSPRTPQVYRKFKGDECEDCGFVPEVAAQLHVHHTDGDRANNDPENLQTLCANCHALEHHKPRGSRKTPPEVLLESLVV